jgi:hypothetical protein
MMVFLEWLLTEGVLSPDGLRTVQERHGRARIPIGQLAIQMGLLGVADVFRVLNAQTLTGTRFGETAVGMGLLTSAEVEGLLAEQTRTHPSIGSVLVELGLFTEEELAALGDRYEASAFTNNDAAAPGCIGRVDAPASSRS